MVVVDVDVVLVAMVLVVSCLMTIVVVADHFYCFHSKQATPNMSTTTTTTTNRVLTLTLVRHGESTDNIVPIWAGHRDATLTNFGHSQAQRLGESLKDQDFDR
jgi:hypothetical protein